MSGEKKKLFTRADIRGYVIFFICLILAAAATLGVLSLVRGKSVRTSDSTDNGVARSFMFPFVFTDESDALFIIEDDSLSVYPIDDTVTAPVHQAASGDVYYLREGDLYVYDIGSRERVIAAKDLADYRLAGSGAFVLCVSEDGALSIYNGKTLLDVCGGPGDYSGQYFSVGSEYVLFLDGIDAAAGTADLMRVNSRGEIKKVASGITLSAGFGFASGDKYIYCSEGDEFLVSDVSGKPVCSIEGGRPIAETRIKSPIDPCTPVESHDSNIALKYVLSTADGRNSMYYFNGSSFSEIAPDVLRIVYFSVDRNIIIYTVPDGDGEKLVRAGKRGNAEEMITVPSGTVFAFEGESGYLYCQDPDGAISRFNVYNSSRATERIAEDSLKGMLCNYPEKPFVLYMAQEGEKTVVYLVDRSGIFDSYDAEDSVTLYGYREESYLLLKAYGYGRISLDAVNSGAYTRINSNVDNILFFDSSLSRVIYISGGTLCMWNGSSSAEIGQYGRISAVPYTGG